MLACTVVGWCCWIAAIVDAFTVVAPLPSHPGRKSHHSGDQRLSGRAQRMRVPANGCKRTAAVVADECKNVPRSVIALRLESESDGDAGEERGDDKPSTDSEEGAVSLSSSSSSSLSSQPPSSEMTTTTEQSEKPYPIDLPSPVLLSSSMVLAIASTGTFVCFEKSVCTAARILSSW